MKSRLLLLIAGFAPTLLVAQTTKPPATVTKPRPAAAPKQEAKITLEAATAAALKEVPGGKVSEHELEREKGKLIYSFDIKVAGKSGVEEVAIDAMTGEMVSHAHETPADIAKEAAADKAAAAKAAAAKAKRDSIKKAGGGL